MKRKISPILTSLPMASRTEYQPTTEILSSCSSEESLLPQPDSPFIDRQFVDAAIVSKLRAACALLVSGTDVPEEYLAYTKSMEKAKHDEGNKPKARMSRLPNFNFEEFPVSPKNYTFAPELSTKQILKVRPDQRHSRILAHQIYKQVMDGPVLSRRTSKITPHDQVPEFDSTECRQLAPWEEPGSPMTNDEHREQYVRSYDQQQKIPKFGPSKETMEKENRPPSRAGRVLDGLKKYVKPASTAPSGRNSQCESLQSQSRSQSRPSSRNAQERPSSALGWKSWGRRRDSTDVNQEISRVDSAFSSNRGSSARQAEEEAQKLNRALPPLPSLDTWTARPESAAHIADARQYPKKESSRRSPNSTTLSGSRTSNDASSSSRTSPPSMTLSSNSSQLVIPTAERTGGETAHRSLKPPHRPAARRQKSCTNLAPNPTLVKGSKHPSKASLPRSPSVDCLDRISPDTFTPSRSATMTSHKKERGLVTSMRKILRGWSKNEQAKKGEIVDERIEVQEGEIVDPRRKADWMRAMEAQGVKRGVIVPQFGTLTPVVRG